VDILPPHDSFSSLLADWPVPRTTEHVLACTREDVGTALASERPTEHDLAALLSPPAVDCLEDIAQRAAVLTRQRFGLAMQFYAPLYVSNYCINSCAYCGFNRRNEIPRRLLTVEEAVREAAHLSREGFRHLLLVSGEDPAAVPVSYFEELVTSLRDMFSSVSIDQSPSEQRMSRSPFCTEKLCEMSNRISLPTGGNPTRTGFVPPLGFATFIPRVK